MGKANYPTCRFDERGSLLAERHLATYGFLCISKLFPDFIEPILTMFSIDDDLPHAAQTLDRSRSQSAQIAHLFKLAALGAVHFPLWLACRSRHGAVPVPIPETTHRTSYIRGSKTLEPQMHNSAKNFLIQIAKLMSHSKLLASLTAVLVTTLTTINSQFNLKEIIWSSLVFQILSIKNYSLACFLTAFNIFIMRYYPSV